MGLLLYCRAGFESDLATELQIWANHFGLSGFCRAKPQQAFVVFEPSNPLAEQRKLLPQMHLSHLIFARQLLLCQPPLHDLDIKDRATPLVRAIKNICPTAVCDVWAEVPDTDEGRQLMPLCRKLTRPLQHALEQKSLLDHHSQWRAHVLFLSPRSAFPALACVKNASSWPLGIPRLRRPARSVSRSAMKLEEAIYHFFDPQERKQLFKEGKTAVDLGAAPGGWSQQLIRRGMFVTAVDNGSLHPSLANHELIDHLPQDGFSYQPDRPVDLLVCDMVEKPSRVSKLMAQWLARGHSRVCIFNLKLPMKKRFVEIQRCRQAIETLLAHVPYELQLKQLYHDRQEITGVLRHGIASPRTSRVC